MQNLKQNWIFVVIEFKKVTVLRNKYTRKKIIKIHLQVLTKPMSKRFKDDKF